MLKLDTYLFFDGTCAEAMRYYERTLGGKIEMMMTVGESPTAKEQPPAPGTENRIMHARLRLGGDTLMASDGMTGQKYEGMKNFSLSLVYPTVAEARKVYDKLADGGQVRMPMQATFWAKAFGMLVDRYGTPWMINGDMSVPTGK